jgi:hypothetical protein
MLLGSGCGLLAQATAPAAPVETTVCDVVKKPASFDGKMVKIKGTVVVGFDHFIVTDAADPNCGFQENGIWLDYPQGTKGKAGPAVIVTVQPAHNFSGKFTAPTRTPIVLQKDKVFKQFDSQLAQTHQKAGDLCLGCARYAVTATLIGRLDGVADAEVKRDASGKIVDFGGFGNMNGYPARLVLQSVADVTAKEIDYSKTDAAISGDAPQQGSNSDAQTALDSLRKGFASMPDSPAKEEAQRALNALPKSGENNGVAMASGATNELKDEGQGTKDSPDGILFNVTFNTDKLQGPAMARAVVHAGEHIADLRAPKPGNENAPAIIMENDAWVVTTITTVIAGQKFLTLSGGYQLWNSNWAPADRNDKMGAALKDYLSQGMQLSQ